MVNVTDVDRGVDALDQPPEDVSVGQIAVFLSFAIILALYIYSAALRLRSPHSEDGQHGDQSAHSDVDGLPLIERAGGSALPTKAATAGLSNSHIETRDQPIPHVPISLSSSPLISILSLNHVALHRHHAAINALAEFAAWMIWFFVADRTLLLKAGVKSYSRDVFLTAFAAIIAIAFGSSLKQEKRIMTLSRQQTEEWKGWMQVMFLLYHYFEAREAYNAIRVLIAGYVWMTGYGNFHYYYRTNDFCIGRFAQMMWRLNFLVIVCCVVLRNDYMLYYICPMHTAFTVFVYVALGIASHVNHSRVGMAVKLMICLVVVVVIWDIPAVFYWIWEPFKFLVGYVDPRKPNPDSLHEWFFRSSLDRYVWIWGMMLAWIHPHIESAWQLLDGMSFVPRHLCRAAILSFALGILYAWHAHVYTLDKLEYNQLHPYTSWIPISVWIVVRNLTPQLRQHSLGFLGWFGCITLEMYISQFHIWLKTIIPNGQPKYVLDLIPKYPLLNFLLVSVLYVGVSHRLFMLTNVLKTNFVPHNDDKLLGRNVALMCICSLALYTSAYVLHSFMYQSI